MFTNERIAALARRYDVAWDGPALDGLHDVLDLFDRIALIDTSGGIKPAPLGRKGVIAVNPIGARLALHEQAGLTVWRLGEEPRRFYHWLGYDACCSCGCGEHRRI